MKRDQVRALTNDQFWKLWDTRFFVQEINPASRRTETLYTYEEDDEWLVRVSMTQNQSVASLYCGEACRVKFERKIERPRHLWPKTRFTFLVSINNKIVDQMAVSGTSEPRSRWFCQGTLDFVAAALPEFLLQKAQH